MDLEVKLPVDQVEQLDKEAMELGISRNEYINKLLHDYLCEVGRNTRWAAKNGQRKPAGAR